MNEGIDDGPISIPMTENQIDLCISLMVKQTKPLVSIAHGKPWQTLSCSRTKVLGFV
jgi:hypothetical protein